MVKRTKEREAMSLDKLIETLQEHKKNALYGGETAVYICLDNSEIEYLNVDNVSLDQTGTDDYGALILIRTSEFKHSL
jgi:hypothetical protein